MIKCLVFIETFRSILRSELAVVAYFFYIFIPFYLRNSLPTVITIQLSYMFSLFSMQTQIMRGNKNIHIFQSIFAKNNNNVFPLLCVLSFFDQILDYFLFRFLDDDDDDDDYDNHKISWYKYELSIILTYSFFWPILYRYTYSVFHWEIRYQRSKNPESSCTKCSIFVLHSFFYMHNSAKLFIFPRTYSCKLEIEEKTQQQQA